MTVWKIKNRQSITRMKRKGLMNTPSRRKVYKYPEYIKKILYRQVQKTGKRVTRKQKKND